MSACLKQHALLLILLLIFSLLAIAYTSFIPLSKAPDEYVHFLYSRFIIENKRLPITVEERQTAGYKSDQPPLYYGLLALASGWVDTTGPPVLKMTWDSPRRNLVDIILPRGMIVWTADETFPYQGIVLAWFAGRWLSVFLSALTIVLVYIVALQIFSNNDPSMVSGSQSHKSDIQNPKSKIQNPKSLALAAAATVAFTPTYMFISAVLNDDNLLGLLGAILFLLLVRIALNNKSWWLFIGLGMLMGLAITTKYSAVILPLELIMALTLIGRYWKWSRNECLQRLGVSLTTAVIFMAWWFIFVSWHFNEIDQLGWLLGLAKPIIAGDASDPTVARLTGLLVNEAAAEAEIVRGPLYEWVTTFFIRFWEVPVFGQPALYPPIYTGLLLLLLCGLALYGLWFIWRSNDKQNRFWLQLLSLHLLAFLVLPLVRYIVSGKIHDTAQARHLLFPTAPAFGILFVWGLNACFVSKRRLRNGYWLLPVVLLALSLAQLYYFNLAFPARLPVRTAPELVQRPQHSLTQTFDDGITLIGYDQQLQENPGRLELVLYWQSQNYTHEDYLTEISLLDDTGRIMAQTVTHPAHGRYPTRAWDPGDTIYDTLVLPLGGLLPGSYKVRLRLLGWDTPLTFGQADSLILTQIDLPALSTSQALPDYFLKGNDESLGFTLWQAGAIAAEMPTYRYLADIPISLYNVPNETDVQLWLLGPDGQLRAAVANTDQLQTFIVDYDWPSGMYWLEAEWRQDNVLLEHQKSQPILRVDNPDTPFEVPPIGHRLDASFNDKILLLGYELPSRRVKAADGVSILLYWQAMARMRQSYTMFVRLLDAEQQVWAGYDRLPREIYSTILWLPGEVVTDGFILPIDPDTPAGIYNLVLGLYSEEDKAAISIPLMHNGAPTEATSVTLGPIKIGPTPDGVTPPGVTLASFQPQIAQNDMFGDNPIISLRGYDLDIDAGKLSLTLYWRSEAVTEIGYTRFIHLRDEQGNTVAQSDGLPGGGNYPTMLWDPDEVIVDQATINLPPDLISANYTLVVGLYDPATGQRLPVPAIPAGDNSVSLTTVALE